MMEDLAYRLLFSQSKTYQYCRKILEVLQMAEKVQTIFGSLNVRLLLTFLWKNILTEVNFQYVLKSSQNLAQKRE